MRKAAALITFEWIQFSGRVGTMKRSQQNKTAESWAERSCLLHQETFLSKQHLYKPWSIEPHNMKQRDLHRYFGKDMHI